ncbi:Protein GLUTAMINE DUMPER 1 [Forsythia ovata]|uniref:Protein GLUTAMINE DUMPER 1 n=1 Tax=Forsythia ovata TaxID=205694 RepID=A0ABD1UEH6_9LAMI
MRAAHNATATTDGVGLQRWNSPIPYLFGGLALMLGLIAFALLILACSYRKSSSAGESSNDAEEKPAKSVDQVLQPEMEPRIVVIMAGETIPSYLANPACAATTRHTEEV